MHFLFLEKAGGSIKIEELAQIPATILSKAESFSGQNEKKSLLKQPSILPLFTIDTAAQQELVSISSPLKDRNICPLE